VIAEMLGVPSSDRHLLRPWSAEICLMYELNPSEEYAGRAVNASVEFSDYLRMLSRERRADPQEDLISALAQVVEEGQRLTEDELIGTCVLLLNAGHEASVNVTGNGWWALFRNPDQLALLQPTCHWSPAPSRSSCATTLPSRCSSDGSWRTRTSVASACRRGRSSGSCSAQRTTTHPSFISPTSWTSPG